MITLAADLPTFSAREPQTQGRSVNPSGKNHERR